MARGPGKTASAQSVLNRLRRLKNDSPLRDQAKRLAADGDTFGAMECLLLNDDVTQAHVDAHARWLDEQNREPEDFV